MKLFYSTALRQWMAILFLITSAMIQVQAVYACELMDNAPRTRCCCEDQALKHCPMGGSCDSEDEASDDCCTVGVTLASAPSLSNINQGCPQDTVRHSLVQPAPVLISSSAIDHLTNPPPPLLFNHANSLCYAGTDTYLLTLRFRV